MKAVILAGGRGTRLAPYTTAFPKPLVPVGGQPILEIILRQLAHYGFTDVVLSVGYLSELIKAYLANSDISSRLSISYVEETEPRGTAGSLTLVPGLTETFLVMNGDILTTLDYSKLMQAHKAGEAVLTVAARKREVKVDLGVIETDASGRLVNYVEKPVLDYQVSMGAYVYEPAALSHIPQNQYFDFPDLVLKLIAEGLPVHTYLSDDYWLDIGRHDDYETANEEFERRRHEFLP